MKKELLEFNPEKNESFVKWEGFKKVQDELSSIESPSGNEENMRQYLEQEFRNMGLEITRDSKGNLVYESNSPEGEMMFCAHMDKLGAPQGITEEEGKICGRLDNALGINLILNAFKEGFRPSVVFTVEEESEQEIETPEGIKKVDRELSDNKYNAGANFVAESIKAGSLKKPKIVFVVDISGKAKVGQGPAVYQSSTPPNKATFSFPKDSLKTLTRITNRNKLGVNFMHGLANDSIEFTFIENVGVATIQVPVDNYHSNREIASRQDIEGAQEVIRQVLTHCDEFKKETDIRTHVTKGDTVSSK